MISSCLPFSASWGSLEQVFFSFLSFPLYFYAVAFYNENVMIPRFFVGIFFGSLFVMLCIMTGVDS